MKALAVPLLVANCAAAVADTSFDWGLRFLKARLVIGKGALMSGESVEIDWESNYYVGGETNHSWPGARLADPPTLEVIYPLSRRRQILWPEPPRERLKRPIWELKDRRSSPNPGGVGQNKSNHNQRRDLIRRQTEAAGRLDADEFEQETKTEVGEQEILEQDAWGWLPAVGLNEAKEEAKNEEGLVKLGGMAELAVAEVDGHGAGRRFAITTRA